MTDTSKAVERFTPDNPPDSAPSMMLDDGGDYVAFSDYADLTAQLAEANHKARILETRAKRALIYASEARPAGYERAILKIEEILREALRTQPTPSVEPVTVQIDLVRVMFDQLCEAAQQSNWIPHEHYFTNDWVSDCCEFLRTGKGAIADAKP